MKKAFGPVVDVGDGVVRVQDHPALGGRINPGQQLGSVKCNRTFRKGRSDGRNMALTLQEERDSNTSNKTKNSGNQRNCLNRSGNQSRGPYGLTEEMMVQIQSFHAASGYERPQFWDHR